MAEWLLAEPWQPAGKGMRMYETAATSGKMGHVSLCWILFTFLWQKKTDLCVIYVLHPQGSTVYFADADKKPWASSGGWFAFTVFQIECIQLLNSHFTNQTGTALKTTVRDNYWWVVTDTHGYLQTDEILRPTWNEVWKLSRTTEEKLICSSRAASCGLLGGVQAEVARWRNAGECSRCQSCGECSWAVSFCEGT